jgi:hypothetical protein
MKPWIERTREEAHLLNPAFCCAAMTSSIAGYSKANNRLMPLAITFMVLPIVLHKHTRELLPRTVRTSIPAWLQEHTEVRLGFHKRLMSLKPYTREAIRYGLHHNWIMIDDSGLLHCVLSDTQISNINRSLDGDAQHCISQAHFIGKWFADSIATETLMALWGVRP